MLWKRKLGKNWTTINNLRVKRWMWGDKTIEVTSVHRTSEHWELKDKNQMLFIILREIYMLHFSPKHCKMQWCVSVTESKTCLKPHHQERVWYYWKAYRFKGLYFCCFIVMRTTSKLHETLHTWHKYCGVSKWCGRIDAG